MQNRVQAYAWGSHTALAALRGEAPTSEPEAELWMGAHPLAPSKLVVDDAERSLPELIAECAESFLGPRVSRDFGALPFLLKLLAAREPLSLQAHPSEEQARTGFAREHAAGLPLGAPTRSYKDPHHKPELIVALTPFSALVGFRDTRQTARLFESLGVRRLAAVTQALATQAPADALRALFDLVTASAPTAREDLATETLAACRAPRSRPPEFARELAWGARIGDLYPGDPGIVLALALNLVVLEPGQGVYLPAGNLHAYLEGTGVEIMASSDNVLRGGLTPKHVDAAELARVLDFQAGPATLVPTERTGVELHYRTPSREFALSRIDIENGSAHLGAVHGPEILVVTAGELEVRRSDETVRLRSGASVFVSAHAGSYTLAGTGTGFRARVNGA